jgi:thiosulfate reductase cytochrome b subunit
MAERSLRRGLPRVTGGEPWPPGGVVVAAAGDKPARDEPGPHPTVTALRRGLPRVSGGEPWPRVTATMEVPAGALNSEALPAISPAMRAVGQHALSASPAGALAAELSPSAGPARVTTPGGVTGLHLRRGLPRVLGGEAWPPAGTMATAASEIEPVLTSSDVSEVSISAPADSISGTSQPHPEGPRASGATSLSSSQDEHKRTSNSSAPQKQTLRERRSWPPAARVALGAVAFGVLTGLVILVVRALLTTEPLQEFLTVYPGEYHLPDAAPVGIPAWIGWQHFFNVFLMVLIIRSGMRVRSEKRPTVFWTSKRPGASKISLALWFHQSLDILWLVNGAVFIVVLFASGQWLRIVPTSWEVFPNALSALLQYLSLNWPTENGWVNYNSLQQLAYFATVFLAAPLAAASGLRMSGWWPKRAERLNNAYPMEWARAVHFPVMLYFVGFIVVHVFLVFATGLLRNLNHMYASQDESSWTGLWIFVGSAVVIAGAWFAARPLILVPIGKLFGKVSGR